MPPTLAYFEKDHPREYRLWEVTMGGTHECWLDVPEQPQLVYSQGTPLPTHAHTQSSCQELRNC